MAYRRAKILMLKKKVMASLLEEGRKKINAKAVFLEENKRIIILKLIIRKLLTIFMF